MSETSFALHKMGVFRIDAIASVVCGIASMRQVYLSLAHLQASRVPRLSKWITTACAPLFSLTLTHRTALFGCCIFPHHARVEEQ